MQSNPPAAHLLPLGAFRHFLLLLAFVPLAAACVPTADREKIPASIVINSQGLSPAEHGQSRQRLPLLPPPQGLSHRLGQSDTTAGVNQESPPDAPAQPPQFTTKGITILEAVEKALLLDRSIQITQRLYESSKGDLQTAQGAFGWVASGAVASGRESDPLTDAQSAAYKKAGLGDTADQWDTVSVSTGLRKQTRLGPSLNQTIALKRTDYRVTGADSLNQGQLQFAVNIPLLKGRGAASANAAEQSALTELRAAQLDIIHKSAETVRDVAKAYWSYLASFRQLEFAQKSEVNARRFLEETQILIDAEQLPKASINNLKANLYDRKMARILREYAVEQAKNALGLAIGLPASQIPAIPLPLTEFPAVALGQILAGVEHLDHLVAQANARRADLLAQQERIRARDIVLQAARQDLFPRLDITMSVGYKGLQEGDGFARYGEGVTDNSTDPEYQLGVSLDVPIENDVAKGALQRTISSKQIAELRSRDLQEQVKAAVGISVSGLQSYYGELQASNEAVKIYTLTVEDELEKFKLGYSTVLDLLQTEDRLNQSADRLIASQLHLAQALIDLRFASGSLFSQRGELLAMDICSLTEHPISENEAAPTGTHERQGEKEHVQ